MHKLLAAFAAGLVVTGGAMAQTPRPDVLGDFIAVVAPERSVPRRAVPERERMLPQRVVPERYVPARVVPRCPPGLAKKNNGCMPPGLAKQRDRSYPHVSYYRHGYRQDRFW